MPEEAAEGPVVGLVTRAQVVECVEHCQAIRREWQEMPDPPELEGEPDTPAISDAMQDAWLQLSELVGTDRVEPDAWPIVLAVDGFLDELDRFLRRRSTHGERVDPAGTPQMWQAWEAVIASLAPPLTFNLPLSIAEYRGQGVYDSQIARIYEWFKDDGAPDTGKVADEAAQPGTWFDPKSWVPAHIRRASAKIEEAWERRSCRRLVGTRVPRQELRGKAPESIEELIRQNVGSKQIAGMKGVTVEVVKELARQLGLPIDGQAPGPALTAAQQLAKNRQKELDRQQAAAERAAANAAAEMEAELAELDPGNINTYAEANNVKEQARQMAWDGLDAVVIHQALLDQYPQLKIGTVRNYVAAAKKEAEA